jgi:hypothetical protein
VAQTSGFWPRAERARKKVVKIFRSRAEFFLDRIEAVVRQKSRSRDGGRNALERRENQNVSL